MNTIIIFALGALAGVICTSVIQRLFLVGSLRIDHSDPDGPFIFLELSKSIDAVASKKHVVLKVKMQDFIPHK